MAKHGHRKITVSLPSAVVADLETICSRMRVSRSALLTGLLQDPVHDLVGLSAVMDSPIDIEEKLRRFRGDSVDVVNSRISDLASLLGVQPGGTPN